MVVGKNFLGEQNEVFEIAKRVIKTNQDIVSEQCIRNFDDVLAGSDEDRKMAWESYEKLLNTEFARDKSSLSEADPASGMDLWIDKDNGKGSRTLSRASEVGISMIATDKANHCRRSYSSRVNAYYYCQLL